MSSLWEPTAPWKSFSKQRICWKGPIGGEICLWHRAGHGGRVWCINNQSSRRGEGAQPTLFSTHQRSLSEWGHCKKCPFIASSATYCHATMHIHCAFLAFSCLRWGWWWGGERNSTDLVAPHLSLLYLSSLSLSLVKLFVLFKQTFLLYGHAELKMSLTWHWVPNFDHLGPVFVSMAVLRLSCRVC